MNGNNSLQRMGQFARFPRHDLSSVSRPPAGELFPVGQMMEGGGIPAPAMMPQQQMPQQYGQGQPTGKKILGMPKDRFIALMGTIAQAMAPETAAGRMGTGLVSMADMMRGERMAQGERQATETEARRKAAAQTAKEKRTAAAKERERLEKKKGKVPTLKPFRVGDRIIQHSWNPDTGIWEPIPGMKGKPIEKAKRPTPPKVERFAVDGMLVPHTYDSATGKYTQVPGMKGKPVKPPTGEKPATRSEKLAHRKLVDTYYTTAFGTTKEGIPHAEYEESQYAVDGFNEMSDKSFVLRRVPGIPKEEKSFMGMDILRPDVPAVPATMEKVPISQFKTPDDVMSADWLSDKAKRRLIEKLFSNQFRK